MLVEGDGDVVEPAGFRRALAHPFSTFRWNVRSNVRWECSIECSMGMVDGNGRWGWSMGMVDGNVR